jgi:hypothetical protein
MKSLSDTGHIIYWEILLVNQLEKYHMGPLIRCGGRRSACARAGKRFTYHGSELMAPYGTFLADLPIYHIYRHLRLMLKMTSF